MLTFELNQYVNILSTNLAPHGAKEVSKYVQNVLEYMTNDQFHEFVQKVNELNRQDIIDSLNALNK